MMSWMLRSRQLAEFVQRQGGADDQLFGGSKLSPRMDATVTMRTAHGRNDYRFARAHAHPDRFIFTDEAFRFSREGFYTEADWQPLGSGHAEAKIVEAAQSREPVDFNPITARVLATCCGGARCINSTTPPTDRTSSKDGMPKTTIIFARTVETWPQFCCAWNVKTYADSR